MQDMRMDMRKLENLLSLTMDTATRPGALPFTRIPSVAEQAQELLQAYGGCKDSALAAAARVEEDLSWRTKLPDVLLQQVPLVGVSTLLLRELWRNIRRCALIAHLHGHDTSTPETQALILTCLISTGAGSAAGAPGAPGTPGFSGGASAGAGAGGGQGGPSDVGPECDGDGACAGDDSHTMAKLPSDSDGRRRLASSVARAMARETFARATGLRFAGLVFGLLETATGVARHALAGPAASSSSSSAGPGGDAAAPGSAALAASGGPGAPGSLGLDGGVEGIVDSAEMSMPSPAKVALIVFAPPSPDERPGVLAMLVFAWLLPILVAAARFVAARMVPLLQRRVQMELPLPVVVVLLLLTQGVGVAAVVWIRQNSSNFVSIPATLVFVIYAILPGTSTFLATRSILQGASEAPYFVLLGVYNLASGYLRWADDLCDDAALEKRPVHRVAQARERVQVLRRWLWVVLIGDFVAEEVMGRVCRMHSWRLLSPSVTSSHLTLIDYRTMAFAMGLLAAWAQGRVLDLLRKRTVLLRMLGARQAILAGSTLLLMGVYAFAQYGKTVSFLRDVSPTSSHCCLILWIRQFGALAGVAVPLVTHMLLQPSLMGCLDTQVLVPVALVSGAVLGHGFSWTLNVVWREKGEHLESDYRVLNLLPHMSAQGRRLASDAMRLAKKRCAEATTSTAMEWAASRVVRTLADMLAAKMLSKSVGI